MEQTDPPAKVASNDQLGLGAEARNMRPWQTIFSRMVDGDTAQNEAEQRIEEILGLELLGVSFDAYDDSLEIFPLSETADAIITHAQHEAILALGCSRYWINFADGTERYCRGERKKSAINRWEPYNRYQEEKRSAVAKTLATERARIEREVMPLVTSYTNNCIFENEAKADADHQTILRAIRGEKEPT
jgi:hypothetical protein